MTKIISTFIQSLVFLQCCNNVSNIALALQYVPSFISRTYSQQQCPTVTPPQLKTKPSFGKPSPRSKLHLSMDDNDGSDDGGSGAKPITSKIFSHHVAIKTRDIEMAIKFYSLFGFEVESKFVSGPARAAWLKHNHLYNGSTSNVGNDGGSNGSGIQSRIELLEVPAYMLNEEEGTRKRAIDLTKREELLGLNHFALDVTGCIPRPNDDPSDTFETNSNVITEPTDMSLSCSLYQLQEYMEDLNQKSMDTFGKSLRVALPPTKRIIGKDVYEIAFIYDADGSLLELLNYCDTLSQDMEDGWTPWNGKGFVG